MAKCSHCGAEVSLWSRDVFTGLCRKCQRSAARSRIGCGSLLLTGLVVLSFNEVTGASGSIWLPLLLISLVVMVFLQDSEIAHLRVSVEELQRAVAFLDSVPYMATDPRSVRKTAEKVGGFQLLIVSQIGNPAICGTESLQSVEASKPDLHFKDEGATATDNQ